jgi:hypothetical protein
MHLLKKGLWGFYTTEKKKIGCLKIPDCHMERRRNPAPFSGMTFASAQTDTWKNFETASFSFMLLAKV